MVERFPALIIAQSTRKGGEGDQVMPMNISYRVGDSSSNVDRNRKRFFAASGIRPEVVTTTGQVHGPTVRRVLEPGHYERCDGLITDRPGLFLATTVADCLPVYLCDPVRRAVGVVHAGWRGSREEIVGTALGLMSREFSTVPADLWAYLGPGAGRCCYEVGRDVANQFPAECLESGPGGKTRLDLALFNRNLLLGAGVPESQIGVSEHCTIHEADVFHSYRRDGIRSGRMMGIIGLSE